MPYYLDYKIPNYLEQSVDTLLEMYLTSTTKTYNTKQQKTRLRQTISCFCFNVLNSVCFNLREMDIILSPEPYSKPLIYNGTKVHRKVSYRYTIDFINWIVDSSLGKVIKGGIVDWELSDGIFIPKEVSSSKLIIAEQLAAIVQNGSSSSDLPVLPNVIEIRDATKNAITKRLEDYQRSIVCVLDKYNHLARQVSVQVDGRSYNIQAKKIYSNSSFEQGGRCYLIGDTKILDKEIRPHITIDNQQTVEIDYKALHPRIAATLEGIRLDKHFDPYGIQLDGCSKRASRWYGKWALLILLNTGITDISGRSTLGCAIGALNSILVQPNNKKLISFLRARQELTEYVCLATVIRKVVERNMYINIWLRQPNGLHLQNIDSRMMDIVLNEFVKMNELVVPVHDSIVVKKDLLHKAKEVMHSAYEAVLHDAHNCIVEVKGE